jgi:hypothetical protein
MNLRLMLVGAGSSSYGLPLFAAPFFIKFNYYLLVISLLNLLISLIKDVKKDFLAAPFQEQIFTFSKSGIGMIQTTIA